MEYTGTTGPSLPPGRLGGLDVDGMVRDTGMDDDLTQPIRKDQRPPADADPRRFPTAESGPLAATVASVEVPSLNPATMDGIDEIGRAVGADVLSELWQVFQSNAERSLALLRTAVLYRNAEALRRTAHGLKGSSANLGADQMAVLCLRLEQFARMGAWESVEPELRSLEAEFSRVKWLMKMELDSRRAPE